MTEGGTVDHESYSYLYRPHRHPLIVLAPLGQTHFARDPIREAISPFVVGHCGDDERARLHSLAGTTSG